MPAYLGIGYMSVTCQENNGSEQDTAVISVMLKNTTMGEKADNDDTERESKPHVCSRLVHVQVDKRRGDTRADSISVLRGSGHDSLTSSLNSR